MPITNIGYPNISAGNRGLFLDQRSTDPFGLGQNRQNVGQNQQINNTCSTCNKSFSIKLEDHLNTNSHISAIKKMFCHYCGVQFNMLSDLHNHQRESRDHQLKIIVRKLNHPLFKIEPEDPKEELELELQKLVYYLYYSNAFPYEVSLEYLKCYQRRMSSKGICQEGKKSVNIPLLEILKEDIEILLESDKEANSTRIEVLQKMESLIYLNKNLDNTSLLTSITNWNKMLAKIIGDNRLILD